MFQRGTFANQIPTKSWLARLMFRVAYSKGLGRNSISSQDEKQAQKLGDIHDDNTNKPKVSSQISSQKKSKFKHEEKEHDDIDDTDDIIGTKNISAVAKSESKPAILQTCPKCGDEVEAFYMKIHRCEGTD